MSDDRERKIRERAYETWQKEGEPHGRDVEHWHRAAGEVDEHGASEADARPDASPSGESAPEPKTASAPKGRKRQAGREESGNAAYQGDKPGSSDEEEEAPGAGESSGGEQPGRT